MRLDINLKIYKSYIHSAISRIINHDILSKIHPDRIKIKTAVVSARPSVAIYLDDKLILKYTAH